MVQVKFFWRDDEDGELQSTYFDNWEAYSEWKAEMGRSVEVFSETEGTCFCVSCEEYRTRA